MSTDSRPSYAPRTAVLVAPGPLDSRTGGYEYDRRMVAGMRDRGWAIDVRELDASFPEPSAAALDHAARTFGSIPGGTTVVVDGLALGGMPDQVEREAGRLRLVALVHLPLGAELGMEKETAARLETGERRALAAVSLVIVTGRSTAETVVSQGIARDRVVLIEPGTDRAPLARGSGRSPLQLFSAAALIPRKGHEILIRALAMTPHRDWHLTCAGSLDRSPSTVSRLRNQLRELGLEDRVSLVGELDRPSMEACYDSADVFVLATLHETYCMAVAEALAHGLPVVSTLTGAIPDLAGIGDGDNSKAGLLAPPGDVNAFAAALSRLLGDAGLRTELARGARRVRDRLPTWDQAVDRMIAALDRVA